MRRLALAAVVVVLAAVLSVVGVVRSIRGREALRHRLVPILVNATGGPVAIGSIDEVGLRTIVLRDVSFGGKDARVSAARVELVVRPLSLVRGAIRIRRIVVDRVRARLVGTGSTESGGALPTVTVDRLVIRDGRVAVEIPGDARRRVAIVGLDLESSASSSAEGWTIDIAALRGTSRGVRLGEIRAHGRVRGDGEGAVIVDGGEISTSRSRVRAEGRVGDRVDARLSFAPLAAVDVRTLVPDADLVADLHGTIAAQGPARAVAIAADVVPSPGGRVRASGVLDPWDDFRRVVGRAEVQGVDPGLVWTGLPRASIAGRARGRRRGDAWVVRADGRVDDLERSIPQVSGRARMRIALRGGETPRSIDGRIHADLLRTRIGGVAVDRGRLRADVSDGRVTGTVDLRAREGTLVGTGRWDLASDRASLAVDASGDLAAIVGGSGRVVARSTLAGPITALAGPFTIEGTAIRGGGFDARDLRITGSVAGLGGVAPAASLRIERGTLQLGGRPVGPISAAVSLASGRDGVAVEITQASVTVPSGSTWRLRAPARVRVHEGIALDGAELVAGRGRITAEGRLPARGAREFRVRAVDLAASDICPFLTAAPRGGDVDATVVLEGTPAAPTIDASLDGTAIRVEERPVGSVAVRIRGPVAKATVEARLRHPSAGALELDGSAGLWGTGAAPVDVRVRTRDFDPTPIAVLLPRHVRRLGGALDMDLRLQGSLARPRASGYAELRRGVVVLAASGAVLDPVRLRVDADGDVARIALVRAVTRQGTMTGEGRIDFGAGGALDLRLRPGGARVVQRPGMQASASGEVSVGGTLAAPVVSGRIDLTDVLIRPAELPLAQPIPVVDPTIEIVGGPVRPVTVAADDAGATPDALGLALEVHVPKGARVVRSDASIELDGAVRVDKATGAGPRIEGTLWLRKGWFVFQGRRFWLTGGAVSFLGTDPPSAWVDVWAEYRTGEYLVLVGLVGPIGKPDLRLISDPPLGEADVLAVLLFGRPTGALGSAEATGLQRQAVGLVSDYAAPGLRRSVMDVLGLDTFDVEVPASGSEVPGEVRVGRYIGEDLFVSLAQEFGAGVAQVIGAEYLIGRGFSVRASASSGGRGAVDLLWGRRY